MTTFEHAMVGINGVLATGLQRRYGWRPAALAAVAAISPDWDGLTMLGGMALFDQAHRAWGHSIFTCAVLAIVWAWLDYRFDLLGWGQRGLQRIVRIKSDGSATLTDATWGRLATWSLIAILAAWSHLVADLVVSGAATLSHWELKLLWPFSDQGFVYPLVSWGDASATILFVCGMFAMLRWKGHTQHISAVTLLLVILYIAARGAMRTTS